MVKWNDIINPPTNVRVGLNVAVYVGFMILLALAYYSAPPPAPDYFIQRNVTAMFPFALVTGMYVNGQLVPTHGVGGGMVTFTGNGSISAGNHLIANITVYINTTAAGGVPSSVVVKLPGAFFDPRSFDSHGIAAWAAISLAPYGDVWRMVNHVMYDQGGSQPIEVYVDNNLVGTAGQVQIGSQDVTVSLRTNSLLLSLTWVIIAFAVLELRVDNERHNPKDCNGDYYRV